MFTLIATPPQKGYPAVKTLREHVEASSCELLRNSYPLKALTSGLENPHRGTRLSSDQANEMCHASEKIYACSCFHGEISRSRCIYFPPSRGSIEKCPIYFVTVDRRVRLCNVHKRDEQLEKLADLAIEYRKAEAQRDGYRMMILREATRDTERRLDELTEKIRNGIM